MKKIVFLLLTVVIIPISYSQKETCKVDFFLSVDCPISKSMMPEIASIIQIARQDSIEVRLVFCGNQHDSAQVNAFLELFEIQVSYVLDIYLDTAKQNEVSIVPTVQFLCESKLLYFGRIDDSYYRLGRRKRSDVQRDFFNYLGQWKNNPHILPIKNVPIGCILY